jgi:hypothetical protein
MSGQERCSVSLLRSVWHTTLKPRWVRHVISMDNMHKGRIIDQKSRNDVRRGVKNIESLVNRDLQNRGRWIE